MQTGSIREHHGSWFLFYREKVTTPDGRVVNKKFAKRLAAVDDQHRNRKSVEHLAAEILALVNSNSRPSSEQTLREFMTTVYLPAMKAQKKPSTHRSYVTCYKLIEPHMNGLTLRETKTSDIERILEAVAATKRAQTSLNNCRNVLSGCYRYAIRKDYLSSRVNPVREVVVPKGAKPKAANIHAYGLEEIKAIVRALPEPAATCTLVAALSGLRLGEIRGLRWDDIQGDTMTIRRSVWQSHVHETKTEESSAPVPLIPILKKALEAHHRRFPGNGYVFVGERSRVNSPAMPLVLPNVARRIIVPTLRKAGIRWYGWHAFRRGLSSNLNALGVEHKTIQAIMRHADVTTTTKHYIKVATKQSRTAMASLDKAYGRAK